MSTFSDLIRGVSFTLYIIVVVQIFYILWYYSRVIRLERKINTPLAGLLPTHVVLLGIALMGFITEAVGVNAGHVGPHPAYFTYGNPPLLALTVYALHLVMEFEYRRYGQAAQVYLKDI